MRRPLALLLLAALAVAGEPPAVAVSLRIIPAHVCSGGPIPVEVSLCATAPGTADGRLRIHLGETGSWESEPCLVDRGGRTLRLLLPAAPWLRPAWVPAGSAAEQPGEQVEVPEARLVAALCVRPSAIPPLDPAFRGPMPQRFSRATLEVEDCPERAEGWCWASLVVFDQERGDRLSAVQRQALAAWVAGGGSLWWLGDRPLADLQHTPGANGRRLLAGLGRVVVGPPQDEDEAAEDHRHLLRLVRSPADPAFFIDQGAQRDRNPAPRIYERAPVPPLTIGWSLTAFVLFVAWATVGEWRLIGRAGRRWTWATLPVAAVATTALAIAGVEWSLGDATWCRRTVIRDIGADGRILREMVFATHLWAMPRPTALTCGDGLLSWQSEGELDPPRVVGTGDSRRLELEPVRWAPFRYRVTRFDAGCDDSGLAACTTRNEAELQSAALLRAAGPGARIQLDEELVNLDGQAAWHRYSSISRNSDGSGLDAAPRGSAPHLDVYLCHRDRLAAVLVLTTPLPDGTLIRRRLLAAGEP